MRASVAAATRSSPGERRVSPASPRKLVTADPTGYPLTRGASGLDPAGRQFFRDRKLLVDVGRSFRYPRSVLNLYDLIDGDALDAMIAGGYIRERKHPTEPLSILNYTEKAAYDGVWNDVTTVCRGLIYRHDEDGGLGTRWVVARPFPKFFNYGQPGAPEVDLAARAWVTEKLDGSLSILFPAADSYAIATRGSFESEQAIHGTKILQERYADWVPDPDVTYLFELLTPWNRIVVDYGETDDLFLLAMIETVTGEAVFEDESLRDPYRWPGPRVESHPYGSLAEALAAEPRPNAEGFVVAITTGGADVRVKLKQADYVALHRIVTGLNERTVWQHICDGKQLPELLLPLPDEFRPWVEAVAARLTAQVVREGREIEDEYTEIVEDLGDPDGEWTRKDFALVASKSDWSWALFLRLDGRDYRPKLWRLAKPDAVGPGGRVYTEDVA